jgi:hypothetical protein
MADASVADIQYPHDDVFLALLQQAGVLALADEKLQLAGGMQGFLAGPGAKAEQAEHQIAEAVQYGDRWSQQPQKEAERTHDPQRRCLAALQGKALGGKLAQHDVQGRDDDERDRDRNSVGADPGKRSDDTGQRRLDQVGDRRLADPPQRQR